MKEQKTKGMTTIVVIVIFVAIILGCNSQSMLLECRRVTVGTRQTSLQSYTIGYLNLMNITLNANNIGIVLSLSSINQGTSTGVMLVNKSSSSFRVQATGSVYAFSYMAVIMRGDDMHAGELALLYMPPGVIVESSAMVTSSIPISNLNLSNTLQQFGRVEPFISELAYQETPLIITSLVNVNWTDLSPAVTPCLQVTRTIDITKIKISYLAYLPVNSSYLTIRPPNAVERFAYSRSYANIFVGVRELSLKKNNPALPYYFIWTSALVANIRNVRLVPYIVIVNSTTCYTNSTFLNAVSSRPDMMVCTTVCNQRAVSLNGYQICILNLSSFSTSSPQPSPVLWTSMLAASPQICKSYSPPTPLYVNTSVAVGEFSYTYSTSIISAYTSVLPLPTTYLQCSSCNSDFGFTDYGNSSCICREGFFALQQSYLHDQACYACSQQHQECPFEIDAKLQLITNADNSTQTINVQLSFNANSPLTSPYKTADYSQLIIKTSFNGLASPPSEHNWTSPSTLILWFRQFAYAKSYTIDITLRSSILMNNNNTYIYQSPSSIQKQVQYSHPQPAKLMADSMQAVGNAAPLASLVSVLLGSKINLFSFMQVSSVFYLSSYVKWFGYGSLLRIGLTQSMFKLTPTNFFTTANATLPLQKFESDDDQKFSKMLAFTSGQLYITYVVQFLISVILQILAIQVIVRLLTLLFPFDQFQGQNTGYRIIDDGTIEWTKKSTLTEQIQSKELPFRQRWGLFVQRISTKRFIFYTTMLNSQLAFHSFMIFGQFKLTVSNFNEIYNIGFTIAMMGLIVVMPCIGPHTPIVLFKCVGIIYKKRQYQIGQIFVYYVLGMLELIVYGASIALFDHCFSQTIGIIMILTVKLLLMRGYFKNLQLMKCVLMLGFFTILSIGSYLSRELKQKLEYAAVGLMMGVCLIELIKIIRSLIIAVLGLLRDIPSVFAKSILMRVEQHKKKEKLAQQ